MIPSVKFDTKIELDIQMTHSFLNWGQSAGGMSFVESIFGPNPELRDVNMEDDKEVRSYFEKVYKEKQSDFEKVLNWNREHWGKIEEEFIKRVMKLFNNHEFPDGKYICYLSINNCNPRFLEDKTFQMYYKANVYNRTISHELMHFMFYDYTKKKLSKIFSKRDPNEGAYWALAELFNNVVLSLPEYVELLQNYEDSPYPNHEEHFPKLQSLWKQSKNVDEFIISGIEYLERHLSL